MFFPSILLIPLFPAANITECRGCESQGGVQLMVLILDGNLEIGAHVKIEICNLICLRHSFEIFFKKTSFPSHLHNEFV